MLGRPQARYKWELPMELLDDGKASKKTENWSWIPPIRCSANTVVLDDIYRTSRSFIQGYRASFAPIVLSLLHGVSPETGTVLLPSGRALRSLREVYFPLPWNLHILPSIPLGGTQITSQGTLSSHRCFASRFRCRNAASRTSVKHKFLKVPHRVSLRHGTGILPRA